MYNIFTRKREIDSLSNVLKFAPKLTVIAGPVHLGKTTLMNRVIMDLPKKSQVHLLNLREKSFNSVESFMCHLNSPYKTWLTTSATADDGMDHMHTPSTQYPLLVIDQANELKKLLRYKDGQAALENLFQWFIIHNTKELQKFHVVLISSENFFDQWVEQFVGPTNYSVHVIGHFDREEAEIYWKENMKKNEDLLMNIDPLPEFDKVLEICGGSMY